MAAMPARRTPRLVHLLIPSSWKERIVSIQGREGHQTAPKKKLEMEYLTFLSGFCALAPKDAIWNNLALSDVLLREVKSEEVKGGKGQVYTNMRSIPAHGLIEVTCDRNKLYAHFVNASNMEWGKDEEMLRTLHESFKNVDTDEAAAS